jgi:hypothetical protein
MIGSSEKRIRMAHWRACQFVSVRMVNGVDDLEEEILEPPEEVIKGLTEDEIKEVRKRFRVNMKRRNELVRKKIASRDKRRQR